LRLPKIFGKGRVSQNPNFPTWEKNIFKNATGVLKTPISALKRIENSQVFLGNVFFAVQGASYLYR
jgi:hypothetical protein